jgi:hypothetical protein
VVCFRVIAFRICIFGVIMAVLDAIRREGFFQVAFEEGHLPLWMESHGMMA